MYEYVLCVLVVFVRIMVCEFWAVCCMSEGMRRMSDKDS